MDTKQWGDLIGFPDAEMQDVLDSVYLEAQRSTLMRIGTAAWSIPKEHAAPFPAIGSHLERYGAVLNAVEIKSSFYRPHRTVIYERWVASVPEGFRFAVKVPKAITHECRLKDVDDLLDRFLSEVSGLGPKLGPLLVQLPRAWRSSLALLITSWVI
jgi:uncharacterized protein YecE (DUF72 family)